MYIATKYIGKKYTPGEILPDDLPKDQVKWLLEAGAIRVSAPAAKAPEDNGDDDAENAPETPDAMDEAEDEALPEDEIDEEAEAPEIDVMDGLVTAPAEEKKPARAAKSAGKTAKGGKAK